LAPCYSAAACSRAFTVKAEAGQPNKEAMDEEDLRSYHEAMVRGPLRALLGKDVRMARTQQ
jgi:hypothetical protein